MVIETSTVARNALFGGGVGSALLYAIGSSFTPAFCGTNASTIVRIANLFSLSTVTSFSSDMAIIYKCLQVVPSTSTIFGGLLGVAGGIIWTLGQHWTR